nr:MGMT family protein [Apibacter mensalis]
MFSVRAVNNANRIKKIFLLVPYYKVIVSDESLAGYGGEFGRNKNYWKEMEKVRYN